MQRLFSTPKAPSFQAKKDAKMHLNFYQQGKRKLIYNSKIFLLVTTSLIVILRLYITYGQIIQPIYHLPIYNIILAYYPLHVKINQLHSIIRLRQCSLVVQRRPSLHNSSYQIPVFTQVDFNNLQWEDQIQNLEAACNFFKRTLIASPQIIFYTQYLVTVYQHSPLAIQVRILPVLINVSDSLFDFCNFLSPEFLYLFSKQLCASVSAKTHLSQQFLHLGLQLINKCTSLGSDFSTLLETLIQSFISQIQLKITKDIKQCVPLLLKTLGMHKNVFFNDQIVHLAVSNQTGIEIGRICNSRFVDVQNEADFDNQFHLTVILEQVKEGINIDEQKINYLKEKMNLSVTHPDTKTIVGQILGISLE
ncbi:Hypothetical_protein [Hexamita inflata]|uniref:Hypothetical_protein n=1 Tax=Hexamita inflata TaxID=28002 RepID=A0AA86TL35_9EUKA|nr:Hypothetical protein HINF_LOCUS3753 [Hexamita inflata]